MRESSPGTLFILAVERCTGCGACVPCCPMHILEIRDQRCRMLDSRLCLECATCVRTCPQQAITITAGQAAHRQAAEPHATVIFTPVLDSVARLTDSALQPQRVDTYDGIDLADLEQIETPDARGMLRVYTADKLLKMYHGRFTFFDQMCIEVCGIVPGREYDLPIFMFDWSESADSLFYICDLYPTDDPGRNADYLERYLHDPLEESYQEIATLPGFRPAPLYWVRAICSPYMVTGTFDKLPRENLGRLVNTTLHYLQAWIGLWRRAQPQDPDAPHMRLVRLRRQRLNQLYRENDPGIGSLNKFLGEKRGQRILEMILPQ